jgi:hypothetical protein
MNNGEKMEKLNVVIIKFFSAGHWRTIVRTRYELLKDLCYKKDDPEISMEDLSYEFMLQNSDSHMYKTYKGFSECEHELDIEKKYKQRKN